MNKSDLVIPDKYLEFYKAHKIMNPEQKLYWAAFKKSDVEFVDKITELAKKANPIITNTRDWDILREIFDYFTRRWPSEWQEFKGVIDDIRHTRRAGGYSATKGIKYVAALPPRFERIIKKIFPNQQFNREFVNTLARKMSIFKVGGEKN